MGGAACTCSWGDLYLSQDHNYLFYTHLGFIITSVCVMIDYPWRFLYVSELAVSWYNIYDIPVISQQKITLKGWSVSKLIKLFEAT